MYSVSEQLTVIRQNVVDLLPEEDLLRKLERSVSTSTPLRVKLGLDPSKPDIHIGHAVVLSKLRQFQDCQCGAHLPAAAGAGSDRQAYRQLCDAGLFAGEYRSGNRE